MYAPLSRNVFWIYGALQIKNYAGLIHVQLMQDVSQQALPIGHFHRLNDAGVAWLQFGSRVRR